MRGSLTRTLAFFLLLSILLLLLAVCVCYYAAYMDAKDQAMGHAQSLLKDTVHSIENELSDVTDGAVMLANESSLYQFIRSDVSSRFRQKELLQSLLKSFTDFKPLVIRMNLYIRDKSALLSGAQETEAYSPSLYSLFLRIKDDYKLLEPYRNSVLTACYGREDGKSNFAILTPVYAPVAAPRNSDYLGSLVALCDIQRIRALLPDGLERKMLLCEGESVLFSNDASFTQKAAGQSGVLSSRVGGTPWTLYTMAAPVDLNAQLAGVRTVCIVSCTAAILAQALLLLALRRGLVEPIIHIADQTDGIVDGTLTVQNPSHERNELTRLTNGINSMLARVQHLNTQMLNTRLKLYKERVMFLQTQMNPHFLYNNLACIRGMAGKGAAKAVREMASSMASIYRYCAKSEPVATLDEEYACVQMYEAIYALRNEQSRYTLRMVADEAARACLTPRMFLQPLVENAFRHGYAGAGEGALEIISAFECGCLTVQIIDHGEGMAEDMLEAMNDAVPDDSKASNGHLGIMNVWRRIQLIFGDGSGMRFSRTPGGGLTVTVTLMQADVKYGKNETA